MQTMLLEQMPMWLENDGADVLLSFPWHVRVPGRATTFPK